MSLFLGKDIVSEDFDWKVKIKNRTKNTLLCFTKILLLLLYHESFNSILLSQLKLLNQLGQWRQLLLLHQLKLINKKDKMLETGIQVILKPKS